MVSRQKYQHFYKTLSMAPLQERHIISRPTQQDTRIAECISTYSRSTELCHGI